nr:ATP-binding protein [Streptomyces sp. TS71-3]
MTGDRPRQARKDGRAGQQTHITRRVGHADLQAVPETRHALRLLLEHWGEPGRAETAELLATELITNALVHTNDEAVLTATVEVHILRVEVRDCVDRVPKPRVSGEEGTGGRGLLLVQSLADAWGVCPNGTGKVVWFELAAATP